MLFMVQRVDSILQCLYIPSHVDDGEESDLNFNYKLQLHILCPPTPIQGFLILELVNAS